MKVNFFKEPYLLFEGDVPQEKRFSQHIVRRMIITKNVALRAGIAILGIDNPKVAYYDR
jgi:hypothetical protein